MWTKQYTLDGKIYYYNSMQNKSVWYPPIGSEIHEAINLQYPQFNYHAQSNVYTNYENNYISNSAYIQNVSELVEVQNHQNVANNEILNISNNLVTIPQSIDPSLR